MSHCFKNNNIKTAKEYIDQKINDTYFCNYSAQINDNKYVWEKNGSIIDGVPQKNPKKKAVFKKEFVKKTVNVNDNVSNKFYVLRILSVQDSTNTIKNWIADTTAGAINTKVGLSFGQLIFKDKFLNVYDVNKLITNYNILEINSEVNFKDTNGLVNQTIDNILKDNKTKKIQSVGYNNNNLNLDNIFNTHENELNKENMILLGNGTVEADIQKRINNRYGFDVLIELKDEIKIYNLEFKTPTKFNTVYQNNNGLDSPLNFLPRDIELYSGKKNVTKLDDLKDENNLEKILDKTIVGFENGADINLVREGKLKDANNQNLVKIPFQNYQVDKWDYLRDLNGNIVEKIVWELDNSLVPLDKNKKIVSNLFKINYGNKILSANNFSNYLTLKKGLYQRANLMNRNILLDKDENNKTTNVNIEKANDLIKTNDVLIKTKEIQKTRLEDRIKQLNLEIKNFKDPATNNDQKTINDETNKVKTEKDNIVNYDDTISKLEKTNKDLDDSIKDIKDKILILQQFLQQTTLTQQQRNDINDDITDFNTQITAKENTKQTNVNAINTNKTNKQTSQTNITNSETIIKEKKDKIEKELNIKLELEKTNVNNKILLEKEINDLQEINKTTEKTIVELKKNHRLHQLNINNLKTISVDNNSELFNKEKYKDDNEILQSFYTKQPELVYVKRLNEKKGGFGFEGKEKIIQEKDMGEKKKKFTTTCFKLH